MYETDFEKYPSDVYVPLLIKSIGEEDADGNYIFEVEASNENLDLQNQKIQQNALLKSKEFFITNGVISDDHQHKRYDKDGNVISDKSKIIGEPISVRTEGTSTFVKGKLYGSVAAAKDFIKLLKAHSSRVKASVGGIMPTVRKNPDGTETVTSFRWNDLALTCSPVNYTVGSAVFAKSMTNVDFCKALMAGSGTDAAEYNGGRALQKESLEGSVTDVLPEKVEEDKDADIINELVAAIGTGEIKTEKAMINFLTERGFSNAKARASVREIISQGGHFMAKSSVFAQTKSFLKSLAGGTPENEDEKKKKKPEDVEIDEVGMEAVSPDGEGETVEEDEVIEKCKVKKSIDDELPDGYEDVTETLGAILSELKKSNEAMEAMSKRMDSYEANQADIEKSVLEVAKSFGEFAESPMPRKTATSLQKSTVGGGEASGQFTNDDWQLAKSVIMAAVRDNAITLEKSEKLSSECQKALHGGKMSREVWSEMSQLCSKYNK